MTAGVVGSVVLDDEVVVLLESGADEVVVGEVVESGADEVVVGEVVVVDLTVVVVAGG